ncbi:MAG TPA: porin, partial [Burkholderiaceae bacterium]|nr:porin [Burkholderiaceae bacterium]
KVFCSNRRRLPNVCFTQVRSGVRRSVRKAVGDTNLRGDTQMKKSLLALAVLGAFAAGAQAQSNVTLYGRVDVGLQKVNKVAAGNSSLSGAVANDALNVVQGSGSRLGFQGTEDLGGGLKAIFQIEHRFDPDTGLISATQAGSRLCLDATGNVVAVQTADANGNFTAACPAGSTAQNVSTRERFWQGRSYVGLTGGFGTLKLGREYTPAFWVGITGDPWGYDTIAQIGTGPTIPGSVSRFANIIDYKSPTWGGFNFEVAYVPSEISSTPDVGDKDGYGANVTWSGGPVYVGLGYEKSVQIASGIPAAGLTPTADITLWNLTGTFKIGLAKLYATYAQSESEPGTGGASTDTKALALAASFDVGAGQIRVGGSQIKTEPPAGPEPKLTKYGVGYHHNVSKRTTLYVDAARAKQSDPDLNARTGYDLGIKHNF